MSMRSCLKLKNTFSLHKFFKKMKAKNILKNSLFQLLFIPDINLN